MVQQGVVFLGVEIVEKDLGWERIKKELKHLDNSYTAVGWFGTGSSPETNVAGRAMVNEYGSPANRIPSRPFIRKTATLHQKKLEERKTIEYNKILEGNQSSKKALARVGEWYVGRIKWVITTVKFIANAPLTTAIKGSSRPLIDTGQMRNSTTHREIMK